MVKRCFDILVALLMLMPALPVMVLVAILARIYLGSPVLFGQVRPGQGGRLFKLYKFRSMTDARDASGNLLPDEARLTPFGQFLRSSSLDELPQLLNALKGDISLVGPRPLLVEYLPLYTREQARRHEVKPGITGWAQVNGRNAISWEQKFKLDVWYVDHASLWLDLRVLALTVKRVLVKQDINAAGCGTMPRFTGSADE